MSILQANGAGLGGAGAPGGALAGGGILGSHAINQSLRFNDDDSASLSNASFSTPTDNQNWSWSAWIKLSTISTAIQVLFQADTSSVDVLQIADHKLSVTINGATTTTTAMLLRDPASWYHILWNYNGSNSKLYVNGELQITVSKTGNTKINNASYTHYIGTNSTARYFDGYMAEVNFIDGTALYPTSFGETIGGVWVPKAYSGSFGTNGFYLPFAQDASSGASAFFDQDDNSYIAWTDPGTEYEIGASDDYTLELFFNPTSTEMSGASYIAGYYRTTSPAGYFAIELSLSNNLVYLYYGNGASNSFSFSAGDVVAGKWHHLAFNRSSGNLRCFLDGAQKGSTLSSNTRTHDIPEFRVNKAHATSNVTFDGYISNVRLVIGSAVYADGSSITVPTSTLTAVTNTKILACTTTTVTADASSNNVTGTTSGGNVLGNNVSPFADFNFYDDNSGNTNDFTANGLAASDVVPDSPTNNFATMNELQVQGPSNAAPYALSEGSLKMTSTANAYAQMSGAMGVQSGKWYTETYINSAGYPSWYIGWIARDRLTTFTGGNDFDGVTTGLGYFTGSNVYILDFGQTNNVSTQVAYSGLWSGARAPTTGDIIGCAVDFDNRKIWWSINGEYVDVGSGAGDPANGTNPTSTYTASDVADDAYKFAWQVGYASTTKTINFGQDSTFAGATTAGGNADGNGIGDFKYAPPSGFLALCTSNLPDITIGPGQTNQADDFFEPILYTGNGGTQHIGSGGIQHPQDTTTIANSVRFNDNDSAYLSRTPSSAGNQRTWTWSCWLKRGNITLGSSNHQTLFSCGTENTQIRFNASDDTLDVLFGGSTDGHLRTSQFLRDTSAFYNIVVQVDTTQSTSTDRCKVYINGTQVTSFGTSTYPAQNYDTGINNTEAHNVGRSAFDSNRYFDGYMAEVNFIDGTALDPTYFGQIGSNGYWIPKTISGLTYGTNGFRLTFQNSSYLGYDYQTSNRSTTNDFSVSNLAATDQVIDSPTQNFSTMDPNRYSGIGTFSEGNLTVATTTNNRSTYGTIAVPSSGKWYYEVRVDSYASGGGAHFGWGTDVSKGGNEASSSEGIQFSTYNERVLLNGTGQSGGYGSTGTDVASNGDVYSVLLDVDNGLFYYAKNGTYFNSANPSNSTGGLDVSNVLRTATTEVRPNLARGGSYNETYTFNFGQDPSFNGGETAPGTDKTDANGVGKFLYDVPTGFLALMDDNIPQEGVESPDFVWIKERNNNSKSHYLFNTVRGATNNLHSDSTTAEATDTDSLLSFDYQGFTVR